MIHSGCNIPEEDFSALSVLKHLKSKIKTYSCN